MKLHLAVGVLAAPLLLPTAVAQSGSTGVLLHEHIDTFAVDPTDPDHIVLRWLSGATGFVEESTDGGLTFVRLTTPPGLRVGGLEISSSGETWISGRLDFTQPVTDPLIYRRTGGNWVPIVLPPLIDPVDAIFPTATIVRSDVDPGAWFVSRGSKLPYLPFSSSTIETLYTLDDGATWSVRRSETFMSSSGTHQRGVTAHTITRDSQGLRFVESVFNRNLGTWIRDLEAHRPGVPSPDALASSRSLIQWFAPALGDGIEYRNSYDDLAAVARLERRESLSDPWVLMSEDEAQTQIAVGRFNPDLVVRTRSSSFASSFVDTVEVSRDGGASWTTLDTSNLSIGQYPRLALGPFDESIYLGTTYALVRIQLDDVPGIAECLGAPNSTGDVGELIALGRDSIAANSLRLIARQLPEQVPTLFLASRDDGFVPGVAGSAGNLCLGGEIGRFQTSIGAASPSGEVALQLDLDAIPQPTTSVAALPGETWRFQAWHRDLTATGAPTSNFTRALAVTFTP